MKKSENVIYSYDGPFTAAKRDAKFKTRYVKGVPFVKKKKGIRKVAFSQKMVCKRVINGWTSKRSLLEIF